MNTKVFFKNIPEDWVVFALDNGCCVLHLHEDEAIDTAVYAKVLHPVNDAQLTLFLNECERSLTDGSNTLTYPTENRQISGYDFSVVSSIVNHEGIGEILKTGYFCVLDDDSGKLSLITIFTTLMFTNIIEDEEHIHNILDNILVGSAN